MPNAMARCGCLGVLLLVVACTRAEAQSAATAARLSLGAGETWDLVWTPRPGRYVLKVESFNNFEVPVIAVPQASDPRPPRS